MKQLVSILLILMSFVANAQTPYSQSLENGKTVDTAKYKATYQLRYKNHPDDKDYMEDTRILLIGKEKYKDCSEILLHFDSIHTEESRRGSSTYSNPTGNPWPLEIIGSLQNKTANIKYRLPIMTGTLRYEELLPTLAWNFVPDSSMTILGYECQEATTEYAGRIYKAWFTTELPLPYGPYKFGGLPGLILRIQDAEGQYNWECSGFEKCSEPIMSYEYDNEKGCSPEDAAKTIARYFKSPYTFLSSGMGGARIMVRGSDGKFRNSSDIEEQSIPYIPLEIK